MTQRESQQDFEKSFPAHSAPKGAAGAKEDSDGPIP